MNRERRKRVQEALDLLQQASEILADVADQEDEAFDNLPESIQESERGKKMEEMLEALDEAMDDLDGIAEDIRDACDIRERR